MSIAGETFVAVHAISADLEKEIAFAASKSAKEAEKILQLKPSINPGAAKQELGTLENAVQNAGQKLGVFGKQQQQNGVLSALLGKSFQNLKGDVAGLGEEAGAAAGKLGGLAGAASAAGPAGLAVAAALAAIVAGIALVSKGVSTFENLALAVGKFRDISGLTAEQSSRLVKVLGDLGVSPDAAAVSFRRFAVNLGTSQAVLAQYGVEVAHTKNGNVDTLETFLRLADAVSKESDSKARNTLVTKEFGRQAASLVPILARGRAELERELANTPQGLIFRDSDIAKARELSLAQHELKDATNAAFADIGRVAIPILTKNIVMLTQFVEANEEAARATLRFGQRVVDTAARFDPFAKGLQFVIGKIGDFLHISGSQTAASEQLADETDDVRTATYAYVDAELAAQSAALGVTSARLAEGQAQRDLSRLLKQGRVDQDAVTAASERADQAARTLTRSEDDLTKAVADFAKVQEGASPHDLAQAQLDADTANTRVTASLRDYTKAQREARHDPVALQEAYQNYEQALLDADTANDNLQKTQDKGKPGTEDYIAAQNRVNEASDRVLQATKDQAKAEDDLRKARQGDPDFDFKVAEAKQRVATAGLQVASANIQNIKALDTLHTAQDNYINATAGHGAAVDAFRGQIDALNTSLLTTAELYQILGIPTGTPTAASNKSSPANGPAFWTPFGGHRAGGGDVEGGYWYQVNEHGTEFFSPKANGTVIPIGRGGPAAGGGGVNITQHIRTNHSPEATAAMSALYIGRALRTARR